MKELLKDFNGIETAKDLKKRGLTLSEYNTLAYVLKELANTGKAEFTQQAIYDYLTRFNLKIKTCIIGWRVEL